MGKCTIIKKECKFARELSKKLYCEIHANKIGAALLSEIKSCPLEDPKIKASLEKKKK